MNAGDATKKALDALATAIVQAKWAVIAVRAQRVDSPALDTIEEALRELADDTRADHCSGLMCTLVEDAEHPGEERCDDCDRYCNGTCAASLDARDEDASYARSVE